MFELTDAGRRHLDEHHHSSPPWVDEDEPEAFQDLRSQLKQLHVAAVQLTHAGQNQQIAAAAEVLAEARRRLYRILAEDEGG